MMVVNKHTLELTRKEVELAAQKCRMEIIGVIKRQKNPEWKQKFIDTMRGLTEEEIRYVNF